MPSFQHELFVELFRSRPTLAREILLACAGIDISGSAAELAATDLSQLVPAQFLADCVTLFRDGDTVSSAVIVEIQLAADPDKRFTWPVYLATLRAKLALLSAIGHPDGEVAFAAPAAIQFLPADHQTVYFDVVVGMLPEPVRRLVEAQMLNFKYEYQSDFARKYFSQGKEEGLHEAVLSVARAKLGELAPQEEANIRGVHDLGELTDLVTALGRAPDAASARAVLDQLPKS